MSLGISPRRIARYTRPISRRHPETESSRPTRVRGSNSPDACAAALPAGFAGVGYFERLWRVMGIAPVTVRIGAGKSYLPLPAWKHPGHTRTLGVYRHTGCFGCLCPHPNYPIRVLSGVSGASQHCPVEREAADRRRQGTDIDHVLDDLWSALVAQLLRLQYLPNVDAADERGLGVAARPFLQRRNSPLLIRAGCFDLGYGRGGRMLNSAGSDVLTVLLFACSPDDGWQQLEGEPVTGREVALLRHSGNARARLPLD